MDSSNFTTFEKIITDISYDFISADPSNFDGKINQMLKMTGEFFEVDRSYLFVFSNNGRVMTNTHEWCATNIASLIEFYQNYELHKVEWFFYKMKETILKNQLFYIGDVNELPEEALQVKLDLQNQNVKAMLLIPVSNQKEVLGFFGFDSVKKPKLWNNDQISLIRVIGNLLGVVITKNKAELEVLEAKRIAEIANNAKSLFLANMSHEIRTPLNSVIGFGNLLSETTLDITQKKYLSHIQVSAKHLLEIVNDILDLSKVEAGKMTLLPEKTPIQSLIRDTLDIIRIDASKKNLPIELTIHKNVPLFADIDALRFKQILLNLLSNGIKFTDKGYIHVTLGFESVDSDKNIGNFLVSVKDTGIGIPESKRKSLFKVFSQADPSTTRKFGGTGLGLVISNRLAEKMGSSIILHSEEGVGSTFFFTVKTKYYLEREEEFKINKGKSSDLNLNSNLDLKLKILIVEDIDLNLLLAKKTIQKILPQSTIITAENGKEAIDMYFKESPHLVFMDIQLPIMDGCQATIEIRKRETENRVKNPIPIIALTAGAIKEEKDKALSSGMNEFCTKPIQKNEIERVILNLFDQNPSLHV